MIGFLSELVDMFSFLTLTLRARRLVERGAEPPGKLQCVVVGSEMKEEQPRLLVQHVAVDCRHVDAIRPQRP